MALTSEIAEWVLSVSISREPVELWARGKAGIIDTVAVILAGLEEPLTSIGAAYVASERSAPAVSRLGTGDKYSVEGAAFVNAMSGHALDYDDVSNSAIGHPSVVVLPALLAVAEDARLGGAELLEAYLVGVELVAQLGSALGSEHYLRGWHATSTVGSLAAAVAVGKLIKLSRIELCHAMAIASSFSSGIRSNFGTMVKSLNAAHASRSGIAAARLASLGFTGNADILGSPLGYFELFGYGYAQTNGVASALGAPWDILRTGISVKKYPCCYATHRAIEGVLEIVTDRSLNPEDIQSVVVRVPEGGLAPLIHHPPHDGLEGKMSLEFTLAVAIVDRRVALSSFSGDSFDRPILRQLMGKVRAVEDSRIETGGNPVLGGYVEVGVTLVDGAYTGKVVTQPSGGPGRPLSERELAEKFHDCVDPVIGQGQAAEAIDMLLHLEELRSLDALFAVLTPSVVRST